MSDELEIVKRLLAATYTEYVVPRGDVKWLVTEIERLQDQNERLLTQNEAWRADFALVVQSRDDARAEIERLRVGAYMDYEDDLREVRAEVERLREELTNEDYEDVTRERDEARAEVKRLRDALDEIRATAALHYIGGAFDPEHMRAIANYVIGTLDGENAPDLNDQPPPVLVTEVERLRSFVQRVRLDLIALGGETDES